MTDDYVANDLTDSYSPLFFLRYLGQICRGLALAGQAQTHLN